MSFWAVLVLVSAHVLHQVYQYSTRTQFQYKDILSRYGDSHVKDNAVATVLSLTWEFLNMLDSTLILRPPPRLILRGSLLEVRISFHSAQ